MASVYHARKLHENTATETYRIYEKDSVTLAITDFWDFTVSKTLTAAQKRQSARQQWLDYKTAFPLIDVSS